MTPKPDTINAYLPSYGYANRRATLHVYHETRECAVEGPAYEYIYKCTETNVERRWGLVERISFKDMGEGN